METFLTEQSSQQDPGERSVTKYANFTLYLSD
jgi:hypothetical protein